MRLMSALYNNCHPWNIYFHMATCHEANVPDDLQEKDILIIHGGSDISPTLYKRRPHRLCGANEKPSTRDLKEWALIQRAIELKIPIIGLCRGAQMLCAAAGGFLAQDVAGHLGQHPITTQDGRQLTVNSIHHQMMVPWDTEHKLLAWSTNKLSQVYHSTNVNGEEEFISMPVEPELVWFPTIKGMAIQWHPEMVHAGAPASHFIMKELEACLKS